MGKKIITIFILALCVATGATQDNECRIAALQILARGNYREADSLFACARKTGKLSAGDLLRWQSSKAVLSDFCGAAALCCDIAKADRRFAQSAVNGLVQMLDEQPLQIRAAAFGTYRDCALSSTGCDTAEIKNRLNALYAGQVLFAQQDSLLVMLDTKKYPSGQDFFDAARQRFAQGFLSAVIFPAIKAYAAFSGEPTVRSIVAVLLFEVYRQKGQTDSATLWLSRATLTDEHLKTAAIVFLQSTGAYGRADSLIASLRPSVTKDTLVMRALAINGDAGAAYARCGSIKQYTEAWAIWKCRLAIFTNQLDEITGFIDTMALPGNSAWAKEILEYRYQLEMISSGATPQALKDFSAIHYALFRNLPKKAAAIPLAEFTKPIRDMLCCDIANAFLRNNDYQNAIATIVSGSPDSGSCELRFLYGQAMLLQGATQQGTGVLEQLMLACPTDVFSGRARALLSDHQKKK